MKKLGGFFAVLVVIHGIHHMYVTLIRLLLLVIGEELSLTNFQLGLAALAVTGASLQFPVTYLLKYVSRKALLGFDTLLSLATLLTGLARTFDQLVLCQILQSVGFSTYHPVGTASVSKLFSKKKRGLFMGLHQVGGNITGPITALIAGYLLFFISWRWTLLIFIVPGVSYWNSLLTLDEGA